MYDMVMEDCCTWLIISILVVFIYKSNSSSFCDLLVGFVPTIHPKQKTQQYYQSILSGSIRHVSDSFK